MLRLGLTGGIGTGKSTAADFLRRRGLAVIDTDVVAREIVEPGAPALGEIVEAFGSSVLDQAGRLNRSLLADLVFHDPAQRRRLEKILHPRIRERWTDRLRTWHAEGVRVAVVVIPLLFETGAEREFDKIICTACPAATQKQRLAARGWSEEQIANRLAAQWPLDKKISASNYVIWTEGSLEIHERQVAVLLEKQFGI